MSILKQLLAISFLTISLAAIAGTKTNAQVFINDSAQSASGSLSSARASSDTLQFISCELYGSSGSILCRARNSAGTLRTCSTTDPALVKAVQMINSASYVTFWWDNSGYCSNIFVRNGSNYLP